MEAFWFWFMKSVAEVAFGIFFAFALVVLYFVVIIVKSYLIEPYKNYKEKKFWMSKDPEWVISEYRYHYNRRYSQYSDWKDWMQEVYDIKKQQQLDG